MSEVFDMTILAADWSTTVTTDISLLL